MARYFVNDNRVSYDEFTDEVVVVHFHTGSYYSLTGSAARVWLWMAEGHDSVDLLEVLRPQVDAESAEGVERFVSLLLAEDLMEEVVTGVGNDAQPSPPTLGEGEAFEIPLLQKFDDMQDLIVIDPIHEVDDRGWPQGQPG